MALGIVKERPILGYGPDNFVFGVPKYRTATEPFEVQQSIETSAHGWLSGTAAASGLAGIGVFAAIVVAAIAVTVRAGYRPVAWLGAGMLAAFLGAGLTTVNELGTEWLLWMSVGTIAGSTAHPWPWTRDAVAMPARGSIRSREPANGLVPSIGYVALGAAIVLALATLNALDASRSAQESQQARFGGRTQQAVDLALHSTTVDPRRGDYWDTLGLAYVQAARLTDAVAAFRRATELAPYDFRYSGDLARAYLELVQKGDQASVARARDVAERSVQMDPNNPVTHLTRAVVMQVIGDLPEALISAQRAIELDQTNNRDIYLTATQVLIGLGRHSDAVDMARRGIARVPDPRNQLLLRVELARALALNGQLTEALNEIAATLVIDPTDSAAQQLRTQLQAGVVR
jgi:tetratricopeptide (TPR) repeat protein